MIIRLRNLIPIEAKLNLFKAIPHLTYCHLVCSFCRASDTRRLERVQENCFNGKQTTNKCFEPLNGKALMYVFSWKVTNYLCMKSVDHSQAVADSQIAAHELLPGEWQPKWQPKCYPLFACKGLTGAQYRPG